MKALKTKAAPKPKRPPASPPMTEQSIKEMIADILKIRNTVENYSANLRPLDRRRLKGVGIRTLGFIEEAFDRALANPSFLPQYAPIEQFSASYNALKNFHELLDLLLQTRKIIWNLTFRAANAAYDDALSFYSAVNEGAKKGIAEYAVIYDILFPFFKKTKRAGAAPTQKEAERDFKAVLHGKRDGEVAVRSVKPKVLKGRREVVDEKYEEEFTTNKHK